MPTTRYVGADISRLVEPILAGKADMVIGDRETGSLPHFSPLKKLLQRIGSGIVRKLAGIDVPDTVSGFRAFSREAAIRLNIVSNFSYTIETVIQAGKRHLNVVSVPIRTNPAGRPSMLVEQAKRHAFGHFSRSSSAQAFSDLFQELLSSA